MAHVFVIVDFVARPALTRGYPPHIPDKVTGNAVKSKFHDMYSIDSIYLTEEGAREKIQITADNLDLYEVPYDFRMIKRQWIPNEDEPFLTEDEIQKLKAYALVHRSESVEVHDYGSIRIGKFGVGDADKEKSFSD